MELGGPGTSPLPPLLLLLLGAGFLPGKFQGAGRIPFRPVQGGLGPPDLRKGGSWLQSQASDTRNGAAAEAPPTPHPPDAKDCPSSAGGARRRKS